MTPQKFAADTFNIASGAFLCTFSADIKLKYMTRSTQRALTGCNQVLTFGSTHTADFSHLKQDTAEATHGVTTAESGYIRDFTEDDATEITARQDT